VTHVGTVPTASNAAVRGILFISLSVLLFSCMDALIKWLATDYPLGQLIFFRNCFAFLPLAPFLYRAGGVATLRTSRLGGHMVRGLAGLAAMACTFLAFALLPLADAVALTLSGPLFLTALSVPLLGERVGVRRWSAVVVGFAGVLVMTRPGAGVFEPAALLAIAGAVLYALAMISIRRLSTTEPPTTIVFYFTLIAMIVSGFSLPFQWTTPDFVDFLLLVALGLLGGSAQLAMTQAFRLAPVALIAPFEYTALIFAMGFGWLFWRDVPDVYLLAGAALVIGSGLYILHREAKLRQERARP
jgi:drug/metabolite transporter (DMT)-like permease